MKRLALLLVPIGLLFATPAAAKSKPPGFDTIQLLCKKTQQMERPRAHSRGEPVGDGRFLAVVHDGGKTEGYTLAMVQLEQRAGKWAITGRWPLVMKSEIRGGNPRTPASLCSMGAKEWRPYAALFVKDYDGDKKPEAHVRLKFCWMIPAIGATAVRTMQLYNIGPKGIVIEPALSMEIEHDARPTTMGHTIGRYRFKDLDGDGHADIRMRVTSTTLAFIKDVSHQCKERSERRFFWKKAGDRYVEAKSKKGRVKRRCKKTE